MKYLILCFVVLSVGCSSDDNFTDPITGTWLMVTRSENSVGVSLEDCRLQTQMIFFQERRPDEFSGNNVMHIVHTLEENDVCQKNEFVEAWYKIDATRYRLDSGSLISQQRSLVIESDTLKYSFEGWDITDSGIIVTQVEQAYVKIGD